MRFFYVAAMTAMVLFCAVPAKASVPYYNRDLGYTIWLAKGWKEVSPSILDQAEFLDGIVSGMDSAGRSAGYVLEDREAHLTVTELHGRVVSKTAINNFNRYVVRQVSRHAKDGCAKRSVCLRRANFDKAKNMLRMELDAHDSDGRPITSVIYIVYTSQCMIKCVGTVLRGDEDGLRDIDATVSSLYFDRGLRQETVGALLY
ncbi:hypothetical protein [Pseudodesulfovibrio sp. zrk46]|uniref:hypothetical protein n=1 Tax=Pseudodesulfovibrio sp. zrk46 TaxID=2725288 RepID=UPI001449DE97|nr:hypothetical protein [Pseudodesulfovibrio sp. zrk46]QJB55293.1 hypothetical protein HFN16_02265 [Pseudodesulfovibrio sp. zrk46]